MSDGCRLPKCAHALSDSFHTSDIASAIKKIYGSTHVGCAILRGMTKDQALQHYAGNQSELARVLGIDPSTVCKWADVPPLRQIQLERITKGKLKADPDCFEKQKRKAV